MKHVVHMIVQLGFFFTAPRSAAFQLGQRADRGRQGSRGARGVSDGVLGGQARKEKWQKQALWGDSLDNTSAHAGPGYHCPGREPGRSLGLRLSPNRCLVWGFWGGGVFSIYRPSAACGILVP